MNKIRNYLIILLALILVAGGIYVKYTYFKSSPKVEKIPELKLAKNEKAKIIISGNTIQATTEKSSAIKKTNPRAKKKEIIIKKDNTITIKESIIDFLPLDLHASLQLPGFEPTIGVRLIRIYDFGASANINLKGLSLSVERDLYDIFPVLQNSYAGLFYRANYDGYMNFGLQFGVYL